MIKEAIARLAEGKTLSREEARAAMLEIMSGDATAAQVAAYITALRIRGETMDVIAGSAAAMREKFTAVHAPTDVVVDTCGTGGDGSHTFNISTASALVAAGAGVTVAKHGNRGVSSKCGSADVLAALGVNIDVAAPVMDECLKTIGIAFLFAPTLHPAMKFAIGPRREIGIRTVFNILGPLSNPAGARYGVLGVYDRDLALILAQAASALGAKRLFVVHGSDGLDEITTTGNTRVAEVKDGVVTTYEIHPREFGLEVSSRTALVGGEPPENAAIIRGVLSGEKGPRRDIVLLNAAAAIAAGQKARDIKDGIALAVRSIDSGAAMQKLEKLIEITQKAV